MHASRFRTGVSLIEIVLVVALLGVLAAIAAPRFVSSAVRYELDAEASRLATDIDFARRSAVSSSSPWRVIISEDGSSYTVEAVPQGELAPAAVTAPAPAPASFTGELASATANAVLESASRAALSVKGLGVDELDESAVKVESAFAAASLGAVSLSDRVLASAKVRDLDVVSSSDPKTRTLLFDAHGRASREFRLSISIGDRERTVRVTTGGVVSWD